MLGAASSTQPAKARFSNLRASVGESSITLRGARRGFGFAKAFSVRLRRASYATLRALPTSRASGCRYSRETNNESPQEMTERYVFADVALPFHVWVKEGNRWVLRDRAADAA